MSTGWIFIKEKIQNFFTFIKEKAKKTRKSDKQPGIRIATNSFQSPSPQGLRRTEEGLTAINCDRLSFFFQVAHFLFHRAEAFAKAGFSEQKSESIKNTSSGTSVKCVGMYFL